MSICGIIGDSIALGLAMAAPKCDYNAKVGRTSIVISQQSMPQYYKWVAISSGTNSSKDPQIRQHLYTTRKKLNTQRVVWILPVNPKMASMVKLVANVWGDPVVTFAPGPDGMHPKSYKILYKDIKKVL